MTGRWNPGIHPDRPDYRSYPPGSEKVCEVRWRVDGVPTWCPARLSAWAHRTPGQVAGPDGWWGYGEWTLPTGEVIRNWAHQSELRPM